tara:strand:+ start:322 stop:573 length:252 start_codon:yes stop_codon:yes gene_type:complete
MLDEKIIMAIVGIFGGLITFLQKVLWTQGKNNYSIIVKLIDRLNKTDSDATRRHEQVLQEINDLTDDVSFLKGRINGSGGSRN